MTTDAHDDTTTPGAGDVRDLLPRLEDLTAQASSLLQYAGGEHCAALRDVVTWVREHPDVDPLRPDTANVDLGALSLLCERVFERQRAILYLAPLQQRSVMARVRKALRDKLVAQELSC